MNSVMSAVESARKAHMESDRDIFKELSAPFPEEDVEWRIAQSGKKGNGDFWAKCLAYINARAVMDRLDSIMGYGNWRVAYRTMSISENATGVICELSIRINGDWITKEDGSDITDFEPFKGCISSALKRAANLFGIGRYLYQLDQTFATIVEDKRGAYYAKTKDGEFYWLPPALPNWALPADKQRSGAQAANVFPDQPGPDDGVTPIGYKITFGKFAGRTLEQVGAHELLGYVRYLEDSAKKQGKTISASVQDFITRAEAYIGTAENQDAQAMQ